MNDIFEFVAYNTIAAVVLALFVYGVTRVWRHPPLAHLLWLLVLVKLVAPPIVSVDWPELRPPRSAAANGDIGRPLPIQEPRTGQMPRSESHVLASVPATDASKRRFAAALKQFWHNVRPALLCAWLGGAGVCAVVAARRAVRFERRLREMLPVPWRLRNLALEIAARLGVRRLPDLRYAEGVEAPFLWWAGHRPAIVLPTRLLRQADDDRAALILAHELAHLRRRDHWVRAIELVISIVYWWHPLMWLIRRRLHEAEEQSCDAWVCWALPGCAPRYAEVLLQMAELPGKREARLLPATPLLRSFSLKARIAMILENRFSPRVSLRATFAVAVVAVLVLPFSLESRRQAWAAPKEDSAPADGETSHARAASEFPYAVEFEQGATRFEEGDDIEILEIRGTADKFTPGHIYWIRGRYKLASHKKALLAAYVTAMDAENGTSQPFKAQQSYVDEGDGTFTLFLPMPYRGWPHVSFYADGSGFGGNYFGTGDSVLRRWWGSKEDTEKKPINISREGLMEFDHQVLDDVSELTRRLTEARRQEPGLAIVVRAHDEARYQRVADVLKACEKAGISESKISIDH